jgi:hypothetical protein
MADDILFNDIRSASDFKTITFSKYKKTDVRCKLLDEMLKGKIEPACYWSAELISAGHYLDLWETILYYMGKHIHLGNPKMVLYLQMRYQVFKNIMARGDVFDVLHLRNNTEMRKLFAEIICTLTLSNKRNSFESIKINREEEFDITQMPERLKAPARTYADTLFKKDDPKELFIAINEFAYNISDERLNMLTACYWIEWVIDFDIICKKRKEPCYCERRPFVTVENRFSKDTIWIIWDALLYQSKSLNNPFVEKLMGSLLELFSIKYTTASCKKRRYLLYFAVELLTENVPTNIELTSNKGTIVNVLNKIHLIYKQIKKNEIKPGTDFMFANLDKKNTFDQSMKRMELLNLADGSAHH